jgi:hypothetical protein
MHKLLSVHFGALSNRMLSCAQHSDTGPYYFGYYFLLKTANSAVNHPPTHPQGGLSPALVSSHCRFSN